MIVIDFLAQFVHVHPQRIPGLSLPCTLKKDFINVSSLTTRSECSRKYSKSEYSSGLSDKVRGPRAAEFALALATRHECAAYVAYAQVSIAGALDALGQPERAQELRVAAWDAAVRLDDKFTLYDLFYDPAVREYDIGPLRADAHFADIVLTFLEDTVPEYSQLLHGPQGAWSPALARSCLDLSSS